MANSFISNFFALNIWHSKKFLLIITACGSQETQYYIRVQRKRKGSINLIASGEISFQQEGIKSHPSEEVLLLITGKGIVSKQLDNRNNEFDVTEILNKELSFINRNDFHFYLFSRDQNPEISFARRDLIDQEIVVCENYIGKVDLVRLLPIEYPTTMLTAIETLTKEALTLALPNAYSGIIDETLEEKWQIKRNKKVAKYTIYFLTAIFFVFSLANSMLYFSYFKKNEKLNSKLQDFEFLEQQINKLEKDLTTGASIFSESEIAKIDYCKYIDQIGATVPNEITLHELNFNPILKQNYSDSIPKIENNHIFIAGKCNSSAVVGLWIERLKQLQTFQSVELVRFNILDDNNDQNFQISVHI